MRQDAGPAAHATPTGTGLPPSLGMLRVFLSREGLRPKGPACECKRQAALRAVEVKMQLSETPMLLWE